VESKWLKWKMIHKETGLTFNQYYRIYPLIDNNGIKYYLKNEKVIPVLLQSGVPAVYVDQPYYPYAFFLQNKDWIIRQK